MVPRRGVSQLVSSGIHTVDPNVQFSGKILVLVPHMDDAVLGCGGVLAGLTEKHDVRLLYCTDGRGTIREEDVDAIRGNDDDIGLIREKETYTALGKLGYGPEQLGFLPFPEWHLAKHEEQLKREIRSRLESFSPDIVLAPSRFDKHVDHLALNRAAREILAASERPATLIEYFVYYQWKLLPSGDIRTYIKPERLFQVDIDNASDVKRKALDAFVSQTTCFYPWQHKPVLSDELLTKFSAGPEVFMPAPANLRDRDILTISPLLVHLLNWLEPVLKNTKEKLLSIKHRLKQR